MRTEAETERCSQKLRDACSHRELEDRPLEPLQGVRPCCLQDYERIDFCYLMPPGLWSFVTEAPGHWHRHLLGQAAVSTGDTIWVRPLASPNSRHLEGGGGPWAQRGGGWGTTEVLNALFLPGGWGSHLSGKLHALCQAPGPLQPL